MKKILTTIVLIILFKSPSLFCCSCVPNYFCDELTEPTDEKVFIKGNVLDHKEYSNFNIAVFIEVLHKFRDDLGITDTIKLFGSSYEGACKVNPYRFEKGNEIYLGIGVTWQDIPTGFEIIDPDMEQDKYWSFGLHLCTMTKLEIVDNVVKGNISKQDRIREYPLEIFESRLQDCSFSASELNKYRCKSENFIVFPNPSNGEEIHIENKIWRTSITRVNIYMMDGKLMKQINLPIESSQRIKFKIEESGIYILEMVCEEKSYFRKLIVEK